MSQQPARGRIEGLVQDEHGKPLGGATVTATPAGALAMLVPQTLTDENGHFTLDNLHPGHTFVAGQKEEDFYPTPNWSFFGKSRAMVAVEIPEGGEISGILLQLLPVGRLIVKATNAMTGAAIDSISVGLEREGEPNSAMGGTYPGNSWLVPAAPVLLHVFAKGFESAWYKNHGSNADHSPLTLKPRQVLTVTVPLRPVATKSAPAT